MKKKIKLHNKEVDYLMKTSRKAKRMRLAVYCDSSFVVTRPYEVSESVIEKFIISRAEWILSKLDYFSQFKDSKILNTNKEDYLENKKEAFEFVKKRVDYFNKVYHFDYNQINIKNHKTRWGSCSVKRNLNFNYKIIFLPKELADYIIVHELCHLEEFNHSKKFWNLVAMAMPDFQEIKRGLKEKCLNFDH